MLAAEQVAVLIESCVRERTSFCFVRVGDGEGNLLNYAATAPAEDFGYFKTHFGGAVTKAGITEIKNNLTLTIRAADLIGVRDDVLRAPSGMMSLDENDADFLARFRSEFPLRAAEREIDLYAAKRVFRLYKWSRTGLPATAALCSQWVCYDLAAMGFWERLIVACGSIGLIHCSPTLPVKITAELNVKVESILVPDKALPEAQRDNRARSAHYPDEFEKVCERLKRPLAGKTFLVGAGLVGKKYLQVIKDNGGIAIDVGALLDAWDGYATRPLVYRDKLETWIASDVPPNVYRLDKERVGRPSLAPS